MPGRVAEVAAVLALAAPVTVAIAAPVLRAPSERVFGQEIVGLLLDGRPVQMFVVEPPRRMYHARPLAATPNAHELAFRPAEAPTVADEAIGNGDPRALSFAFGAWPWTMRGEQP